MEMELLKLVVVELLAERRIQLNLNLNNFESFLSEDFL
jgi:hypothetical protein